MLADICLLCQDFDLYANWADLQPAGKSLNDVPLLSGTTKKKIDRLYFKDLNVSAVRKFQDAIMNILHGDDLFRRSPNLFPGLFLNIRPNQFSPLEKPLYPVQQEL